MADLLRIQAQLQVFENQTAVDDTIVTDPEVNESFDTQLSLGDFAGPIKQTVAANANNLALTIPSPPYDGVFYLECSGPVELNVNSQGYQRVESVFLSMASTTTVLVRNQLVVSPATTAVQVTLRYLLAKRAT